MVTGHESSSSLGIDARLGVADRYFTLTEARPGNQANEGILRDLFVGEDIQREREMTAAIPANLSPFLFTRSLYLFRPEIPRTVHFFLLKNA